MKPLTMYLTALVVSLTVSIVDAEESNGIPKNARKALQYFVGNWESDVYQNGEKLGTSKGIRKWAPGKHSVVMTTSASENDIEVHTSGISGWDAQGQQLVEHWFGSNGLYAAVRYPLRGMKKDSWSGNFSVTFGDGKSYDGDCELQVKPDGWVWTARWKQDGKEMVRKSVTRNTELN